MIPSINAIIKTLFQGFTVGGVSIPVEYLVYEGHGEPYIVYYEYDKDNSYSAEDELAGFVVYFDFDFYSKGNFFAIQAEVKKKLKGVGFTYEPSRDSAQMLDRDTGYYHQTLCFAFPVQEVQDTDDEESGQSEENTTTNTEEV